MNILGLNKESIEQILNDKALSILAEIKIKKTVNRKGQITKRKTAGKKGKKIVGGVVKTVSSKEKKAKRLGKIKLRKTLKKKSSSIKKRSAKKATLGRAKRSKLGIK